jgi:hypothetical protein
VLTGNDLIAIGLKPGRDFAEILAKTAMMTNREEAISFAKTFIKTGTTEKKGPMVKPGSVLEWLLACRSLVPAHVEGRAGAVTNSEIKRLLENHAVLINGCTPGIDASIENQFPIHQLVFWPKGNRKTTLLDEANLRHKSPWLDVNGNLLDAQGKIVGKFLTEDLQNP